LSRNPTGRARKISQTAQCSNVLQSLEQGRV
jgi:hypothetical protein